MNSINRWRSTFERVLTWLVKMSAMSPAQTMMTVSMQHCKFFVYIVWIWYLVLWIKRFGWKVGHGCSSTDKCGLKLILDLFVNSFPFLWKFFQESSYLIMILGFLSSIELVFKWIHFWHLENIKYWAARLPIDYES